MGVPTTKVEGEAKEEVGEEEKQWKGMKELMKEIQPEDLEEVMLEETLEGEIAEDSCPKVCLIEIKDITRLESGQILQVKGERGMILICISLHPEADSKEIYRLQPLPYWKIDCLWIGVVRGQGLHMRGHLYRMLQ